MTTYCQISYRERRVFSAGENQIAMHLVGHDQDAVACADVAQFLQLVSGPGSSYRIVRIAQEHHRRAGVGRFQLQIFEVHVGNAGSEKLIAILTQNFGMDFERRNIAPLDVFIE